MQILFIGGTGLISTACAAATVAAGHDLWLMNRGLSKLPSAVPPERVLRADAADEQQVRSAVQGRNWDVVVDWVAYKPRQVEQDMRVFGAAGQYIFISSASVYEKPPSHWVITESTPKVNPFWQYSRDKIACEDVLRRAWERSGFPATVVRPTLTYGPSQNPRCSGELGQAVHNCRPHAPRSAHHRSRRRDQYLDYYPRDRFRQRVAGAFRPARRPGRGLPHHLG